jgi:hypothetical protein
MILSLLMLLGNTIGINANRAGDEHALTPLKFAFRPGYAIVMSRPTLFLGALWLPHQRDQVNLT